MKQLILKVITSESIANTLILLLLKIDNFIYKLISIIAPAAEGGTHPKHKILRYKEWFGDRLGENEVVLDIGCNTGSLLGYLAPRIKYGYGIDILENLIKEAKVKNSASNIKYVYGDATSYDFSEFENLSAITMSNVLEHIDERILFLNKIKDCLNGRPCRMLIRVPLITRDWLSCYKKEKGVDYRLDPTHFTEYRPEEIRAELDTAGFTIDFEEINFGEIYLECRVNS